MPVDLPRTNLSTPSLAFGVMMYEWITGVHPFQAASSLATLARVVDSHPEPLASRGEVPQWLSDIIERCLKKSPAERFASAAEYERHRGVYVVTVDVMRRLPEGAIVMHPLPRVGEIEPEVDADPRAAYFRQARNGVWTRMAVLEWAMER